MNEINWARVEMIQRKSFQGTQPSQDELELCQKAIQLDRERYVKFAAELRKEYIESLRGF